MNINSKKSPRSTPSSPLATCLSVPESPELTIKQLDTPTNLQPIITPLDLSNIKNQDQDQDHDHDPPKSRENTNIIQDIKILKNIMSDMKEQELISPRVKILANTRAILQNTSNILSTTQMNHNIIIDDINQLHKRINTCLKLQEDLLDLNLKILYKINKLCDKLEQDK